MGRGSLGHGRLFLFRSITSARIARWSPSSRPMASCSVRAPAMSPASARAAAWRYRSASAEARGLPLDCPRSVRVPPFSGPVGSPIALISSISRESSRVPSSLEIMCTRKGTEGSNPSLSARKFRRIGQRGRRPRRGGRRFRLQVRLHPCRCGSSPGGDRSHHRGDRHG
jgi:hypothetical protein